MPGPSFIMKKYDELTAEGWSWVEDQESSRVLGRIRCLRLENPTKQYCLGKPHVKHPATHIGIYEREPGNHNCEVIPFPFSPSVSDSWDEPHIIDNDMPKIPILVAA